MPINLVPLFARQALSPPYRPKQPYSPSPPSLRCMIVALQGLRAYPVRPTRALHVPPVLPRSTPVPARSRSMTCLGCGAPIGGLAVCSYCLRRS